MIGHYANELRHHKFREDRMMLPVKVELNVLLLVVIVETALDALDDVLHPLAHVPGMQAVILIFINALDPHYFFEPERAIVKVNNRRYILFGRKLYITI